MLLLCACTQRVHGALYYEAVKIGCRISVMTLSKVAEDCFYLCSRHRRLTDTTTEDFVARSFEYTAQSFSRYGRRPHRRKAPIGMLALCMGEERRPLAPPQTNRIFQFRNDLNFVCFASLGG